MNNKRQPKRARVHSDLGEIELEITEFGEITGTLDIDEINEFLNRKLEDPKLNSQDNPL